MWKLIVYLATSGFFGSSAVVQFTPSIVFSTDMSAKAREASLLAAYIAPATDKVAAE